MKWVILILALAACHGEEAPPAPGPKVASFVPESPASGAAVFLRGRQEGEQLRVDVVARGAADVHGTAFRLTFDPNALAYAEAQASFPGQSINVTKEARPGELVVAWAEKGAAGFPATNETVLGTITFDVKSKQPTTLAFRAGRSSLIDRNGAPASVVWRGGSFAF